MYTLSSNILKWSYNQKNVEGQHFEGVSHSMGYYSMVVVHSAKACQIDNGLQISLGADC